MSKDSNRPNTEALHQPHHTSVCGLSPSNKVDFHFPVCGHLESYSRLRGGTQLASSWSGKTWVLPTGCPLWPQGPSGKASLSQPGLEKQKAPGWPEWPFPGFPTTFLGGCVQFPLCPQSLYVIRTALNQKVVAEPPEKSSPSANCLANRPWLPTVDILDPLTPPTPQFPCPSLHEQDPAASLHLPSLTLPAAIATCPAGPVCYHTSPSSKAINGFLLPITTQCHQLLGALQHALTSMVFSPTPATTTLAGWSHISGHILSSLQAFAQIPIPTSSCPLLESCLKRQVSSGLPPLGPGSSGPLL